MALVGRTVDLETLVDFDKLLRIAKLTVANLQYLGGLSLLISFPDVESARVFMDAKKVWGPWFSKLDFWSGQTLPLERVAWLKLCGIPLHLLDPVVLGMIGESFGKLLHVPRLHEEDLDLSMVRVGVLVGNPGRIKETVTLRWKDKVFRIWVEEDSDVWIPDSVEKDVDSDGVDIVSPEVSPVDDSGSGSGEMEGLQSSEFEVPVEESPINVGSGSQTCMSPRRVEREKVAADFFENVENSSGNDVPSRLGSSLVGPGGNGGFEVGTGGNKRGPIRRRMMGQYFTKAQSSGPKEDAPVVERPKKRPRSSEKEEEPGFGFVGFTSSPRVHLDLNVCAQNKDPQVDASCPLDNQVDQPSRDRVSTAEEEINATIEIGAQVGMEFGQKSDQALNILGLTGINVVKI
ncbi:hypothetical protein HanPSC8_Chr04g0149481 [Helianthus annuus]|nr:hypothetical protein HanPSC8_Chr04g0149481 [Helianthus annuus]